MDRLHNMYTRMNSAWNSILALLLANGVGNLEQWIREHMYKSNIRMHEQPEKKKIGFDIDDQMTLDQMNE